MKHTPGPWEVSFYNPCGCCVIPATDPNLPPPSAIAVCYGPDSRQNADLIAAAPELLAALEACHDVLLMDPRYEQGRAISMANRAIARAKGELK